MTKNNILFASLLLAPLFMLCTSCGSSNKNDQHNMNASKANNKFVFDIPSLVGKNIDEIRKVLGNPSDQEIEPSKLQMKMNFDIWDNTFERDNQLLLVTFNPQNRHVIDFFIATTDPSGSTSDYSDLMQICNLSIDNEKYSIEPVPTIKDNTKFTGIKIVEK